MWWEWEWFKKSAIIDSVLKEESEFHRFDNLWRPRTKVGRRLRNSFFSTLRVQTFLRAAGDMVVVVMELHREWNIPFRKMSIIGSYRKSLFHNKVGRFHTFWVHSSFGWCVICSPCLWLIKETLLMKKRILSGHMNRISYAIWKLFWYKSNHFMIIWENHCQRQRYNSFASENFWYEKIKTTLDQHKTI